MMGFASAQPILRTTPMSRIHRFVATLAVMLAASVSPAAAQTADPAKDYPARPIRIIAPFGPGGPGDIFSRQLAQYLAELLKQSVYVENRAGAASIIGADVAAKSAPDGYTELYPLTT